MAPAAGGLGGEDVVGMAGVVLCRFFHAPVAAGCVDWRSGVE